MEQTELHAGLIVIIPDVTPTLQRELFEHALLETNRLPDMINKVMEVDLDEVRIYELPKLGQQSFWNSNRLRGPLWRGTT